MYIRTAFDTKINSVSIETVDNFVLYWNGVHT